MVSFVMKLSGTKIQTSEAYLAKCEKIWSDSEIMGMFVETEVLKILLRQKNKCLS